MLFMEHMKNNEVDGNDDEYGDPPLDTLAGQAAFEFWNLFDSAYAVLPLFTLALHLFGLAGGEPEVPPMMRDNWLAAWVGLLPFAMLRVSMHRDQSSPRWTAAVHGLAFLPAPFLFVFNHGIGQVITLPLVVVGGYAAMYVGFLLNEPKGRRGLRATIYFVAAATYIALGVVLFVIEPPEGSLTLAVLVWCRFLLALPLAILVMALGEAGIDNFNARNSPSPP